MAPDAFLDDLAAQGWAVWPDFMPPSAIDTLRHELRAHWQEGSFRAAGVGRGTTLRVQSEVRADHLYWLSDTDRTPAQEAYHQQIEALRVRLNQAFYLGLRLFEAHFAVYPPGSFYRRHLDQHAGTRRRVLSCLLYLNPDWQPDHGGQLRLYPPAGGPAVDLPPVGGTFVCFRSADVYHEVLTARHERYSLSGWLRTE